MPATHGGKVQLAHSFGAVHDFLARNGPAELITPRGTIIQAVATTARRGNRSGRQLIRFMHYGREYGRAFACCWGHSASCSRTRIGTYCLLLDRWVESGSAAAAAKEADRPSEV
ncbi:MAG: hypothetical protein QME94_17930 [Anaerolineae bacterium]|nr:hypothetical protein [Anaerolineae bacterium]